MTLILAASVLPLLGAVWALALLKWPRAALAGAMAGSIAGGLCALAAGMLVLARDGAPLAVSIPVPMAIGALSWRLDGLSAWFLLPLGFVTAAASLHSWGYVHTAGKSRQPAAYGALFCLLVTALVTVFTADDLVLFLIGWELMSTAAFFLVSFEDRDATARRGAWYYLVASHLGTALLIFPLLVLLSGRTSGTSFDALGGVVRSLPQAESGLLFAAALVGFGTKAGFSPFHVWLPIAHPVAPSPVSAMMSGLVIKTGIYGLFRILGWRPVLPDWCPWVLLAVAGITGLYGILSSLGQRQLKRMLAFSSVENVGIIGMGLATGLLGRQYGQPVVEALGFAGALLHVLNHAIFKGLLFLSAGAVLHGAGTGDMEKLGGLARRMPANAALFAVGGAAICAFPPLNGFLSEWLLYRGFVETFLRMSAPASVAGVAGVVTLAVIGGVAITSFCRSFGLVFLGEPRSTLQVRHATPRCMVAGMAILAVACAAIGFAASAMPGLLAVPLGVLQDRAGEALQGEAGPLGGIVLTSMAFALTVAVLLLIRGALGERAQAPARRATWGCGYSTPTPRMQYSGLSFVWTLLRSFRFMVRSSRSGDRPGGCFPSAVTLTSSAPDVAETVVWRPVFEGLARFARRFWPLQRGRIQHYLLYMVAAVLLLFVIEAWSRPAGTARPAMEIRR